VFDDTGKRDGRENSSEENSKSERAAKGCPATTENKKKRQDQQQQINKKINNNKNNSITPPTLPMPLPLSRTTFVHHRSFRFDTSESSLYHYHTIYL